jgi:hypothetical protein
MNSKDLETIFSILGTGVTAVTYIKDGYVIAIAPPAKKAGMAESVKKDLEKLYTRGEPGMLNEPNVMFLKTIIDKYKHNSNYELYTTDNKLCASQHDLGGCVHTVLVTDLNTLQLAWCEQAGVRTR